jgi:Fe-S-cluster containining protein
LLEPEEEPAARRNALRVYDEGGQLGILQPCVAHRGDHCSVYAERPRACVDYRCKLLHRYEVGEIGRTEAFGRIAAARKLADAVRELVDEEGSASWKDLWSAVEAIAEADGGTSPDTVEWRRAHQALLFEVAALRAYFIRHFQNPKPSAPSSDETTRRSA